MTEYINRDEVLSMSYCTNKPTWDNPHLDPKSVVDVEDIESLPAAAVVSQAVFDQVKWERDTALATLEEHGIGLAQKADVVEVVHGEWKFNKDGSGTCNQCGITQKNVWDYDSWQNYCGHCGADMRRIEKRSTDV